MTLGPGDKLLSIVETDREQATVAEAVAIVPPIACSSAVASRIGPARDRFGRGVVAIAPDAPRHSFVGDWSDVTMGLGPATPPLPRARPIPCLWES